MGFRDYSPGLNQFLTRDTYNGALDDKNLATDPFTDNRYAFSGGNPTTYIELDGHTTDGPSGAPSSSDNWFKQYLQQLGNPSIAGAPPRARHGRLRHLRRHRRPAQKPYR